MHHQEITVTNRTPSKLDSPPSLQPRQIVTFKTWSPEDPEGSICHKATLKNGELDPQLEDSILQMKVGDMWEFLMKNDDTTKQICLEVLQAGDIVDEINLDPHLKAEKLKLQGNSLLKEKKYQQAIKVYEQAFGLLQYDCSPKSVELNLSIMSNLALATLNSNNAAKCLHWCQKYIEQSFEPNKKIIYRKMSALKNTKNWQEGKRLFLMAKKQWENDQQTLGDFEKLREQMEKQQKIEKAKERKVYTNMFG